MSKVDTQKIIAPIMKFVNMRGIIALKDGMLAILPLTVVGSLFLIVGQLPFEGLNQAIAGVFGTDLCHYGADFLFFNRLFLCQEQRCRASAGRGVVSFFFLYPFEILLHTRKG